MRRCVLLSAMATLACSTTAGGPTTPSERTPEAAAPTSANDRTEAVDADQLEPDPSLTLGELGWQRPDEANPESAPLLRLDRYDSYGPSGPELDAGLLTELDAFYTCFEQLDAEVRVTTSVYYRVRLGDGADEDGVSFDVQPASDDILACLRATIDSSGRPNPPERSGLVAQLRLFASATDAPALRKPAPTDQTSERLGGTCWVWEEYPCAPKKHCIADEWVRTACPHPSRRAGVQLRWRIGAVDERGFGDVEGLELQTASGDCIWFAPFTAEERARGMRRKPTTHTRTDPLDTRLVEWGPERILVVDRLGARWLDRETGQRLSTWLATEPGSFEVGFDGGEFIVSGRARCEGDAGRGSFATHCGASLLYFDGYTLTVLDAENLAVDASTNTKAKSSKLDIGGAKTHIELRAAKLRVTIDGMTYM